MLNTLSDPCLVSARVSFSQHKRYGNAFKMSVIVVAQLAHCVVIALYFIYVC